MTLVELKERTPIGDTLSRKVTDHIMLKLLTPPWDFVRVTCTLPTLAKLSMAASIRLADASYGIDDVANPIKEREKVPDSRAEVELTLNTCISFTEDASSNSTEYEVIADPPESIGSFHDISSSALLTAVSVMYSTAAGCFEACIRTGYPLRVGP